MDHLAEDLAQRLAHLVRGEGDAAALISALQDVPPADIAVAAASFPEAEIAELFKRLPEELSGAVLVELPDEIREDVLELLTPHEIAEVVEELESDDAADVVSELADEKAGKVVGLLEEEDRRDIAQLLAYPEDSAGGIMQLEVVWVREDRTVARAIEKIRLAFGDVKEDLYYVYVVDGARRLVGKLPLARLILAGEHETVHDIMEDVQSVPAEMDQEEVARIFLKYNQPSLPVVDREGRLLGRITHDDVADVIQDEAEEDYSRLAGTDEEDVTEQSILRKAAIRLPWLVTGLMGGVLSAVVLSRFEMRLTAVIALAFFVPVITAMGGNVAIQSSAVMVRALATGDVRPRDATRRLAREAGVSVITGVICALLIFLAAWAWSGDRRLGIVVGGSMLAVILIATSVGAFVPLTLARLNVDPALATGPFVTTSNDVLGILIYLTLASWMLG
jgi:magnesium transporter